MSRARKVRRRVGDVIAIPLKDSERLGFGLIVSESLIAFFDISSGPDDRPSIEEIVSSRVAFRIWVMNKPIVEGDWPVIGAVKAIPSKLQEPPWFFKEDPISGKITVGRTGAEELTPQPGQVEHLERAAVWSAVHVVDRLQDHFAGRPNKWVASLRPKGEAR